MSDKKTLVIRKSEKNRWECPTCRYQVNEEIYLGARFDYGCPRCKTSLAEFHVLYVKELTAEEMSGDSTIT